MYGVISALAPSSEVTPPNKHARDWVDDKVANGIEHKTEVVTLSEVEWQALYREAYNIYFLVENAARTVSNQHRKKNSARCHQEGFGAGKNRWNGRGVSGHPDVRRQLIAL